MQMVSGWRWLAPHHITHSIHEELLCRALSKLSHMYTSGLCKETKQLLSQPPPTATSTRRPRDLHRRHYDYSYSDYSYSDWNLHRLESTPTGSAPSLTSLTMSSSKCRGSKYFPLFTYIRVQKHPLTEQPPPRHLLYSYPTDRSLHHFALYRHIPPCLA